ncbi:MAG: cytochrome d ubiquinol oxidase subunit II [Chlamydiae bacterium]|nr:cytochrome d ubiquinol oxidase subunit II [Chlamydiota bacterium]
MSIFSLEVIWYLVIIVCMICYSVLDGFDLGVGALHLFTKKDEERRVFLNAIGPVWDGNEVWLVVIVGALLAGFPEAYATLLSTFYNLIMLFLCGLIFRAVAIEFRSKMESPIWRKCWDAVFCIASVLIAYGVGVILGNLVEGIPLNENREFVGVFADFLTPYTLLLGVTSVALFMMHGAIYLTMKTEGKLQNTLRKWVNRTIIFFATFYIISTIVTLFYMPHMIEPIIKHPWLFAVPVAAFFTIVNIPYQISKGNVGWAFISSCFSISFLLSLFAIGTFPTLIRSSLNPTTNSLFIWDAASSPLTLKVLLIIVIIGVPLVIGYSIYIYRLFRGKVKIEKGSY